MSAQAMAWAWRVIAAGFVKTPATALVLVRLADRADPEGIAWPGHYRTARDLTMTERGVAKCLAELRGQGLIRIEERHDRIGRRLTSRYFLQVDRIDFDVVRQVKLKRAPDQVDQLQEKKGRVNNVHPQRVNGVRGWGEQYSPPRRVNTVHPNPQGNLKGAAALQPVDKAAALLRLRELRSELAGRPARGRSPAPDVPAVDNPLP